MLSETIRVPVVREIQGRICHEFLPNLERGTATLDHKHRPLEEVGDHPNLRGTQENRNK